MNKEFLTKLDTHPACNKTDRKSGLYTNEMLKQEFLKLHRYCTEVIIL